MFQGLNKLIDKLSDYLAPRKGLLPTLGILMILANLVLQFLPPSWLQETNLLLHIGLLLAIFGLMLAWIL